MRFHSIRFKTRILFTAILGIILAIYSGALFYAAQTILYRGTDESLVIKAREVGDILQAYQQVEYLKNHPGNILAELFQTDPTRINREIVDEMWHAEVKTLNLKRDYIRIETPEGRTMFSSGNVTDEEEALFSAQLPVMPQTLTFKNIKDTSHDLRAVNFPLLKAGRPWLVIQVGTPLAYVKQTLKKLKIFIVVAVFLILLVTSFLGGIFARSVLEPVGEIAATANRISHKDLNIRITENQSDEEIRVLVTSFNTMLDRIERSFGHINEFSSLVAHELKTPLAILRGEMELALSEERTPEQYQQALAAGMDEAHRLIKIIKDLLLLANLDYRADIFTFEKIDLTGFIRDICEHGRILAQDKDIELSAKIPAAPLFAEADKVHLRRLFFNLLTNAVKFTPPKGQIGVQLIAKGKTAVVAITDTGIGIDEEDRKRIFDKFYRAANEGSSEPGNGLGLSIAQSIAQAHHGKISVDSTPGRGSVFTVTLPLA